MSTKINSKHNNELPKFSSSQSVTKLKDLARGIVNLDNLAFETKWQSIIEAFKEWEDSPIGENTSRLNMKLHFLDLLCRAFPNARLHKNENIADIILSSARAVGEEIMIPQSTGGSKTFKIVGREITDRLSISYTLEDQYEIRSTQEFFD
jgi:hypothetical protein